MKKLLCIIMGAIMLVGFSACGGSTEPAVPADLTGDWVTTSSSHNPMWATITTDEILVYWYEAESETKSLYWAGSYIPPTEPGDFTWTSVNDKEQTDSALLASGEDEKVFTYKGDIISYSMSIMGTTTTLKLERVKE